MRESRAVAQATMFETAPRLRSWVLEGVLPCHPNNKLQRNLPRRDRLNRQDCWAMKVMGREGSPNRKISLNFSNFALFVFTPHIQNVLFLHFN